MSGLVRVSEWVQEQVLPNNNVLLQSKCEQKHIIAWTSHNLAYKRTSTSRTKYSKKCTCLNSMLF